MTNLNKIIGSAENLKAYKNCTVSQFAKKCQSPKKYEQIVILISNFANDNKAFNKAYDSYLFSYFNKNGEFSVSRFVDDLKNKIYDLRCDLSNLSSFSYPLAYKGCLEGLQGHVREKEEIKEKIKCFKKTIASLESSSQLKALKKHFSAEILESILKSENAK